MQMERYQPIEADRRVNRSGSSCGHPVGISEGTTTIIASIVRSHRVSSCMILMWCSLCLVCALPGCGYTLASGFNRDVKTVAIPIFENTTNRRGIEFQLTEAVQKEVTKRTPYRLAKGLEADTRLTGKIVGFRKDVLGETRYDDPRELQISLMVEVKWEDLRTGQVLAQQEIPLSPDAIPLASQSEMAPEIGQSLATAMDDAFQMLARKIVNLMETPW